MRLGKAWTLAALVCALPGVAYAQEEPTGNEDARACTDPSEATTAALPSGLAFTSAEITRTYHPATGVHAPAIVITGAEGFLENLRQLIGASIRVGWLVEGIEGPQNLRFPDSVGAFQWVATVRAGGLEATQRRYLNNNWAEEAPTFALVEQGDSLTFVAEANLPVSLTGWGVVAAQQPVCRWANFATAQEPAGALDLPFELPARQPTTNTTAPAAAGEEESIFQPLRDAWDTVRDAVPWGTILLVAVLVLLFAPGFVWRVHRRRLEAWPTLRLTPLSSDPAPLLAAAKVEWDTQLGRLRGELSGALAHRLELVRGWERAEMALATTSRAAVAAEQRFINATPSTRDRARERYVGARDRVNEAQADAWEAAEQLARGEARLDTLRCEIATIEDAAWAAGRLVLDGHEAGADIIDLREPATGPLDASAPGGRWEGVAVVSDIMDGVIGRFRILAYLQAAGDPETWVSAGVTTWRLGWGRGERSGIAWVGLEGALTAAAVPAALRRAVTGIRGHAAAPFLPHVPAAEEASVKDLVTGSLRTGDHRTVVAALDTIRPWGKGRRGVRNGSPSWGLGIFVQFPTSLRVFGARAHAGDGTGARYRATRWTWPLAPPPIPRRPRALPTHAPSDGDDDLDDTMPAVPLAPQPAATVPPAPRPPG